MSKLNRKYELKVGIGKSYFGEDQFITVNPPFTIEFDINKIVGSRFGSMSISITNLSPETRKLIYHSRYLLQDGGSKKFYRPIILRAGYDQLYTLFQGNILEADSYRNGTEVLTTIQAQDGVYGAVNSYSSYTFAAGTSMNKIFNSLTNDLSAITKGLTSNLDTKTTRNITFSGNTMEIMQGFFNDDQQIFVENETINLLNTNDCVPGMVKVINSASGLLGTPRKQDTKLSIDMIFEPSLKLGQIVAVQSSIEPSYNGQYKIMGLRHSGTISEAVAGECKTEIQVITGNSVLGGLNLI
jgi:hypothetical protein